jgi:hypothetical protein
MIIVFLMWSLVNSMLENSSLIQKPKAPSFRSIAEHITFRLSCLLANGLSFPISAYRYKYSNRRTSRGRDRPRLQGQTRYTTRIVELFHISNTTYPARQQPRNIAMDTQRCYCGKSTQRTLMYLFQRRLGRISCHIMPPPAREFT